MMSENERVLDVVRELVFDLGSGEHEGVFDLSCDKADSVDEERDESDCESLIEGALLLSDVGFTEGALEALVAATDEGADDTLVLKSDADTADT